MRYWSFLAAKLLVALAVSYGSLRLLTGWWPREHWFGIAMKPVFGYDLWFTAAIGLWFLASAGLLYLCVLDQRYRCRTCLRRLRMPVLTGSWSRMLQFGRPEIEYICTYGHGRLSVAELQITGQETPAWTPQGDDYWQELTAMGKKSAGTGADDRL